MQKNKSGSVTVEELGERGYRVVESYEIDGTREDALLLGPGNDLQGLEAGELRGLTVPESLEFSINRNEDSTGGFNEPNARIEWLRMVLAWKGEQ